MPVDPEHFHDAILESAAELANRDPRRPVELSSSGLIFAPLPGGDVFSLQIQSGVEYLKTLPDGNQKIDLLHTIGKDAIKRAIVENGDLFAGLILGYARQGLNYFDRFPERPPFEQLSEN